MLLPLHAALSNSLLLLLAICFFWSFAGLLTGRGVTPGLRGTYLVTLIASVAQAVLGVLVAVAEGRPLSPIHALYGVSLTVALAAAYVYGGRQARGREVLLFALAAAFSFGLTLRALETVARFDW